MIKIIKNEYNFPYPKLDGQFYATLPWVFSFSYFDICKDFDL